MLYFETLHEINDEMAFIHHSEYFFFLFLFFSLFISYLALWNFSLSSVHFYYTRHGLTSIKRKIAMKRLFRLCKWFERVILWLWSYIISSSDAFHTYVSMLAYTLWMVLLLLCAMLNGIYETKRLRERERGWVRMKNEFKYFHIL